MILAEKYNETMNRLELSPEARARILGNIRAMELSGTERAKVVRFPQWKRFAAIAACAAVIVLAAVMLHPPRNTVTPSIPQAGVQIANGIVDCSTPQELADAVGFAVPELSKPPFDAAKVSYASYWGDMAEIVYHGSEQSVTLRKQVGNEDVSGDYNSYAEVKTVAVNGREVTLKGNGGTVSTAVWTSDGYSYAVMVDVPVSADDMTALVAQVA